MTTLVLVLYVLDIVRGHDVDVDFVIFHPNKKLCASIDLEPIATSEIHLITECASLIPGTNKENSAWIGLPGLGHVVTKGDTITQNHKSRRPSQGFRHPSQVTGVCCVPGFLRDFEARRDALMKGDHFILNAYFHQPMTNDTAWDAALEDSEQLAALVRVLYLTDAYDEDIKAAVKPLEPFWTRYKDMDHYFWTEPGIIRWGSAAYLLKQKFPDLAVDTDLDNRLEAFLELKKAHGFFEVNAADHIPIVMNALLNLADFSADDTIQTLAVDVLKRLLKEVVDNVNDCGAFYPAQVCSNDALMKDPYSHKIFPIVHLLTGRGADVEEPSDWDVFLLTSSVHNLAGVLGSWTPTIGEKTTTHGIPLSEFATLKSDYLLNDDDATAFKMSADMHWIPEVAPDTITFVDHFGLQTHDEVSAFYKTFKDPHSHDFLAPVTRGSVCNEITSVLFKDGPSMLSSFQNYNPRSFGRRQYPFVATTGRLSVYAKSGLVASAASAMTGISNIHLPNIKQHNNAAIIRYDSTLITEYAQVLDQFGVVDYKTVKFAFPQSQFDEVRVPSIEIGGIKGSSNWILARETIGTAAEGYVALWRACKHVVGDSDTITCDAEKQVYAIFVGSSNQYTDFDAFEAVVLDASMSSSVDGLKTVDQLTIDGQIISLTVMAPTASNGAQGMTGMIDGAMNHYAMVVALSLCWCMAVFTLWICVKCRGSKPKVRWEKVNEEMDSAEDEMLFVDNNE
eukprot:659291_1